MSSVAESKQFSNISATTAAFTLKGGKYAVAVIGTFGTSVTFQGLSLDGTTYVAIAAAYNANTYATYDLPPGQYRFLLTSMTAVYASATSVPS